MNPADVAHCYRCQRPMPEGHALEGGKPVCIPCARVFEGDCRDCGWHLTKSEAWLGDVCAYCHPLTDREIRIVLAAGGLIQERTKAC